MDWIGFYFLYFERWTPVNADDQRVPMYAPMWMISPATMRMIEVVLPKFKTTPIKERNPRIHIMDAKCTHSFPPFPLDVFLRAISNQSPLLPTLSIFSRIASIMNSERFLYPKPGFSLIKSSTFFKRGSGILTVVYFVAMNYLKHLFKIKIGSNVDVMYSNSLLGGMY